MHRFAFVPHDARVKILNQRRHLLIERREPAALDEHREQPVLQHRREQPRGVVRGQPDLGEILDRLVRLGHRFVGRVANDRIPVVGRNAREHHPVAPHAPALVRDVVLPHGLGAQADQALVDLRPQFELFLRDVFLREDTATATAEVETDRRALRFSIETVGRAIRTTLARVLALIDVLSGKPSQ